MQQAVQPISHPVRATLQLPGSKSITNRALLLAALAQGESTLEGVLFSDDSEAMLVALQQLGIGVDIDLSRHQVQLQGCHGLFPNAQANLYCRDAGTATRFLIPACAAMLKGAYHFSASPRMMQRPIGPLLQVLQGQGSGFQFEQQTDHMPFYLNAHGLTGGAVTVDIHQSSQFLSGLLIAAPFAKTPMQLQAGSLAKKPYVTMTTKMMQQFGIDVTILPSGGIQVPLGCYQGRHYRIEPDASTASYFFAIAALTGGEITVVGLPNPGLQGDTQFLTILEKMGCQVTVDSSGITVKGTKQLKGIEHIDMSGFSDTFMTVAALAVFADRPMTLSGLAHTRLQESDRIAAISEGLQRLGVQVTSTEDTISLYPSAPKAATVYAHNDHRIAMSLALIGLKITGMVIDGAECVAKTCPDYFQRLQQLV